MSSTKSVCSVLFAFAGLALSAAPALACFDSMIQEPTPFMGNNGEVFILSDGSAWEVKYEYEYMYEYYPSVTVCPDNNFMIVGGKKLNIAKLSSGGSLIQSSVSGSWKGWRGDTIVKLSNGQIWEQVGLHLSMSLGLGNSVLIYEKNGMHYMMVEDEDEAVAVRKLN